MNALAQRDTTRRWIVYALLLAVTACGDANESGGSSQVFGAQFDQRIFTVLYSARDAPVYLSQCLSYDPWETLTDAGWVPLRDESPVPESDAGQHQHGPLDCRRCDPLIGGKILSFPQEYVRVGSMPAPYAGDAGQPTAPDAAQLPPPVAAEVPTIVKRDVSTPLRAPIRYFNEPECKTEHVEYVTPRYPDMSPLRYPATSGQL